VRITAGPVDSLRALLERVLDGVLGLERDLVHQPDQDDLAAGHVVLERGCDGAVRGELSVEVPGDDGVGIQRRFGGPGVTVPPCDADLLEPRIEPCELGIPARHRIAGQGRYLDPHARPVQRPARL
jgi:hypothetical protein